MNEVALLAGRNEYVEDKLRQAAEIVWACWESCEPHG
jgi:hypothetical protein